MGFVATIKNGLKTYWRCQWFAVLALVNLYGVVLSLCVHSPQWVLVNAGIFVFDASFMVLSAYFPMA